MGANGADLPGKASKFGGAKSRSAAVNGGKGEPFWANFGANLNQQSKNLGDGVNRWWTSVSAQSKTWKAPKWEMPVHVDVDFLGPFVLTVKKSARDFYVRLPVPLQQGLPYFAVGATTGMLVWKIQGSRLKAERKVTDKLQSRVETLLEERDKLQNTVKDMRNKSIAPRSASDMKMAAAVAEATNAAAAAASAAASAASRCSVIVRRPEKDM